MSETRTEAQPVKNTDREIWREAPGDDCAPSIHVTDEGAIGINVGGMVYVRSVRDWHALTATIDQQQGEIEDLSQYAGLNYAEAQKLRKDNDALRTRLREVEGALREYANRDNWEYDGNSATGHSWYEYTGKGASSPWETAANALATPDRPTGEGE